jgi:hypothetical protein
MQHNFSELKSHLRFVGLTYVALSKKLKIPHGTLAGYLNGVVPMPERHLAAINKIVDKAIAKKPVRIVTDRQAAA